MLGIQNKAARSDENAKIHHQPKCHAEFATLNHDFDVLCFILATSP
jgi:hypothetical protein